MKTYDQAKKHIETREARLRARLKLLTGNFTTYAYALTGAALVEPYIKGEAFNWANVLAISVAVAMHALAWYIAPRGEKL
ncbi:hypothetical protein [Caulobacter sp. NIBR2454]|uniref:hypothetical protein n=1 Tax=Caulobacter sp. NIBR2454 TaxID=3015996 RepID=UPI0022B64808|nr:hypothetical protein [Caulobacter sp. NIBR2454]